CPTCWEYHDRLPSIDSISKKDIPLSDKKRGQAPEGAKAIQVEVQKLVKVGILREVYYHNWLSNLVMVRKHNGSWRMCMNFTYVNKACPQDCYPLPERSNPSAATPLSVSWTPTKAIIKYRCQNKMRKKILSTPTNWSEPGDIRGKLGHQESHENKAATRCRRNVSNVTKDQHEAPPQKIYIRSSRRNVSRIHDQYEKNKTMPRQDGTRIAAPIPMDNQREVHQKSLFSFSHQDYVSQIQMGGSSSQPRTDPPRSPINAFPIEELYTPEFLESLQENTGYWQEPNTYEAVGKQVATSPTKKKKKKETRNLQKRSIQTDEALWQNAWKPQEEITLAKDSPKFQEIQFPNFNQGSDGSSKRHKSSGSSSFNTESRDASINLNTIVVDEDEVQELRRPGGRDKARAAAKNNGSKASGSSTMNDDALARLMVNEMTSAEVQQRKAFMELKRREVERCKR
nr:reverse transcriptase domain-containing protein [Tanacetum cinerariifolium]